METLRIHDRWAPGLVGDVAALHARFYAGSHGFGAAFEHKVAAEFGALMERFDQRRDFLRAAERDGRFLGSIAVDGAPQGATAEEAQVRFFLLDAGLRGQGLGRRWLGEAVAHARGAGFRRVVLWTLGGLDPATALYLEAGLRLEEERTAAQFGTPALERRFGLAL